MAPDYDILPIPLAQGVDEKTDDKQLAIGKLVSLQNAVFTSPKKIQKRDGQTAITNSIYGGGAISAGVNTAAFQNELLTLDGKKLYTYAPNLSANVNRGLLIPVTLSTTSVIQNVHQQQQPDSAYHAASGLQIFTWYDTVAGSIQYSIFNKSTGSILTNNQTVISVTLTPNFGLAKVVTLGKYFVIFYFNTATAKLAYKYIDTTAPTVLSSETVITDLNTGSNYFDVTVSENGSAYILNTTSSHKLSFYSLSASLVLSSQYLITPTSAPLGGSVAISSDASGNVWGVWLDGTDNRLMAIIVNAALNATLLGETIVASSEGLDSNLDVSLCISGTTATIFWSQQNSINEYEYTSKNTLTFAGVVGTKSTIIRSLALASKAFSYGGDYYFLAAYGNDIITSAEKTYFLVNSSGQIVMKLAPDVGGGYYNPGVLPEVTQISADVFEVPYLQQINTSSLNGVVYSNTGVLNATMNFATGAMSKLVIANNIHFASGQLWMYDGASVVEHGFHIYPENLTDSIATSGGGIGSTFNTATLNQVQYVALYEWQDNQGQIHRSVPSLPYTVILPLASSLTAHTFTATAVQNRSTLTAVSSLTDVFVGQILNDTTNAGTLAAGTYITAINSGTSTITLSQPALASHVGDTFSTKDVCSISVVVPTLRATLKSNVSIVLYRTQNNSTIFYRVSSLSLPSLNNPTVDYVTIVDSLPDNGIEGNERLYTTGGEVPNFNAPACIALTSFKNRAVLIPAESKFEWDYSKQIIDGQPAEFDSLEFFGSVDQRIGQVRAVGQLDDKLILFGQSSKFYVVGSGPAPNGTQNDFSDATKIAGVSGCGNQASIIETPVGLMYQDSEKGIWLLDRALQEQFIGADVSSYISYPVTSSQLFSNQNKVVFTLSTGVNLVYDYYVNQWETDLFSSGGVDSTVFQNDFVYVQADGITQKQTPGVFNDNGNAVPIALKTGWLNFAGVEGYQRVWEFQIVGQYKSPHTLTVNIYNDFESSPSQTVTIPVLSDPGLYQFRIRLERQKCESVQFEIIESQSGTIGEGFSLSSMAVKVGIKKGLNRLSAGASY